MQLAPYVFFDGTCEAAFSFYADVLGGSIVELNRYEGSPMADDMPPEQHQWIMHATFEAPGIQLMGADGGDFGGEMTRVSLSLGSSDAEEGRRVFEALAAGGTITMPYAKQFWGASFGMLIDRFAVKWMINAG